MSRRKGTEEKRFVPIHNAEQDAVEFKRRVMQNLNIADWGVYADEKYSDARDIRDEWRRIQDFEDLIREGNHPPGPIAYLRQEQKNSKRAIYKYITDAFQTNDGDALRRLADIVDNYGKCVSVDASYMLMYCLGKPIDFVFTFDELLQRHARFMRLKPPYDEAVEKRVRRLIDKLGIRVHKGQ